MQLNLIPAAIRSCKNDKLCQQLRDKSNLLFSGIRINHYREIIDL